MHKMTLYTRRKLHLTGLIAWEIRQKRCRYVCKSQNVCPRTYTVSSICVRQKYLSVRNAFCPYTFLESAFPIYLVSIASWLYGWWCVLWHPSPRTSGHMTWIWLAYGGMKRGVKSLHILMDVMFPITEDKICILEYPEMSHNSTHNRYMKASYKTKQTLESEKGFTYV